jgi:cytochrome P450
MKAASQLPAGPRAPAIVQLVATWTRPVGWLQRLRRRYGNRFTVRLPLQPPLVMVGDPDAIKEIFTAPPDVLHPGEGARILQPVVGSNSVILLDEALHLEQRKLLLPAFHGEKMQRLTGLMRELAEREIVSWPTDRSVALHPRLQRLTLEIILRSVFGLEQGQRLDDLRDLLTRLLAFSETPLSLLPAVQRVLSRFPPFREFADLLEQTDRSIFELIDERRAEVGADRDDVLAMLLQARHEDNSPMSEQELRDELMTALVAGHETTASQLAWAIARLAREPHVVALLREELEAGQGEDYLTATIYEVMRLNPVLPNAEPRLTTRRVQIGDFEYPPGVALLASASLVHHDPAIYPEPHAFRPDRFLDTQPGTYTWIPFGGGRRRCLGASFALQEMKIVLRAVVERYELAPSRAVPERTRRRSITLSPARGATVRLRARAPRPLAAAPPELTPAA